METPCTTLVSEQDKIDFKMSECVVLGGIDRKDH